MTIERADKEPKPHAIPESLTNLGERDKVRRDHTMLKNVTLSIEHSRVAGPGYGWAFVLRSGEITKEGGGGSRETTGCRMALEAAVAGLCALNQPCAVLLLAHNNYLIQGMVSLPKWRANDWRKPSRPGKALKHADLWRELDVLARTHAITCRRIKGRYGRDNERCDRLAASHARNQLL